MKTIKTIMAALVALLIFAPAVYAANADNPDGCKPVGLFGQHSEPFQAYETAAAQTIVEGDPVKLDGSGQIVIGTAIDSALLGFARSGVTASSAGDLIYVYSNPSTVFQCQSSGSFAITMISDLVDLEGSTGIFEVNENASVYKPLRIVGYNPNDSVGANARLYVRLNMASLGAGASGVFEDLSVLDDLTVADDTAIGGLLGVTGDFAVNTTKFTVTAASGNTLVAGTLDITGNCDADAGLDVSGGSLTIDAQAITQTTGGQVTLAGNVDADAGLDVAGAAQTFTGTLGSWTMALADSALTQTHTGQVTFTGNADATLGLDISGAALTVANQAITQTTGGQVTLAGNLDANLGIDVAGAAQTFTGTLGSWTMALADSALTQTHTGQVTFTGNLDANLGIDVAGGDLTIAEGADKAIFTAPALTADRTITIPDANVDLGDVAHTNRTELDAITAAQVTFAGNLDSNAGVDITGGALTIANQAITQTTGGQVDFAGNVDASLGLDVSGAVLSTSGGFTQSAGTFGVVNSAGNATIDNSNATGATYVILGTDTNATTFEVQNDSAADYLKIDGDGDQLYTCAAASADAYRVEAVGGNDYLLIDSLVPSVAIGNATTNPAVSVLGFGQITLGGNVDASAGVDITGDLTLSGHKDSQTMIFGSFDYPEDDGTEWWGVGGAAQLPATITAKNCYINLSGLKVGDEIVSYTLYGTTIENTALTLDATLVEVNSAGTESDPLGDGTNAIAQVDATGDFGVTATFTAAYTVAAGRMYRIKLLGTTGATDTITVQAATGLLNRK